MRDVESENGGGMRDDKNFNSGMRDEKSRRDRDANVCCDGMAG